jgi:hypothetical protein
MQNDIPSFTEILSWWPSDAAAAVDFGLDKKFRATAWRARNSVPPKYWPTLIDKVAQRFDRVLTAEQLTLVACGQHRPIPKSSYQHWDSDRLHRLRRMILDGCTAFEAAQAFKVSAYTIYRVRRVYGLPKFGKQETKCEIHNKGDDAEAA